MFKGSEALRQGRLTPYQLRIGYRAIYPDVYLQEWAAPSLRTRCVAAWLWSGRRGILAGLAAAALYGSNWIDDDEPIELIWRNQHAPVGVITRNQRVEPDELARVAGLPVTALVRTAFDLARRLPRDEAVARLDALMRARPFRPEEALVLAKRYPRAGPAAATGRTSAYRSWCRVAEGDVAAPLIDRCRVAGAAKPDTGE